jgi:hypothetical protein
MAAVPSATDVDWSVHVVGVPGAGVAARIRRIRLWRGPARRRIGPVSPNTAETEAPACETDKRLPPIVTVPVLGGPGLSELR